MSFSLLDAIKRFHEIVELYLQNKNKNLAEKEIDKLNTACEEAGLSFRVRPEQLYLFDSPYSVPDIASTLVLDNLENDEDYSYGFEDE